MDPKEINTNEEDEIQHQEALRSMAKNIHQETEKVMGDIKEYIQLSDADLKLIIHDLKRLANFLDAVIEAYPITFTLSEVMDAVKLDEPTLRQLLVDVGVNLDKTAQDTDETVTERDLIALLADRAGSKEGDLLADFLRGDSPKIVWG
ncbi:MAG TPA: hypothetical protein DCL08_01825 [Anaerolineaceae bacterium]|nr:hypothetical protein [Anaerolineaceae bacterium]